MDIVENVIEYGYIKVDDDFVRFVVVEQILDNNRVRTRYTGGLTEKYEDTIIQIEAEIQRKKDFVEFQKDQVVLDKQEVTTFLPEVEEPSFVDKTKEFFGVGNPKPEFGG